MKLQFLSSLFLLYTGTWGIHCATTTQAHGSQDENGAAVEMTRKIIRGIFDRFDNSVKILRENKIMIETRDLEGTDFRKTYSNNVTVTTDTKDSQTHVEIRCNFTELFQIELQQLPSHKFSGFGKSDQLITKDFNVTLAKKVKVVQPILTYKKNFEYYYSKGIHPQSPFSNSTQLRSLFERALEVIVNTKFKDGLIKNIDNPANSILQLCENRRVLINESLVPYYYTITIKDVQRSFLFDINFDWIRLRNLWNFKFFALSRLCTSNTTNFTLQSDALEGEIHWNYTVHAKNDKKSGPITTQFKIGMLRIKGLLNSKEESNKTLRVAVEDITTNVAECDSILAKILLRRARHEIKENFKKLLTVLIYPNGKVQ